jgi:APA family basic amino acid/polyamine antiporter
LWLGVARSFGRAEERVAQSEDEASGDPRDRLKRELSLTDAGFLVVASVIGAGIFFTPGRVAELLPHPSWILAAWGAGALFSLAGALTNAELGGMFPHAGGDYVYLREGLHPLAGFLVGWLSFFAIYAGTIAALAAAAASMIAGYFELASAGELAVAIGLTIAVSAINLAGVRWGARANNLTSGLKVAALIAFCLFGPIFGEGDVSRLLAAPDPDIQFSLLAFGMAMSPILFSYLGWNASVYVASEIRNPDRNLPLSLFGGLAVCASLYLCIIAVYLYALPISELAQVDDAGRAAALALFGPVGGKLVSAFVLVSVLGTLNATALVGPRIAYAMALDGLFFRGADRVEVGLHTPSVAIAVQGGAAIAILLVLRNFPSALDFTTFAIVIATSADTVALFRLRATQPERRRPYRVWGYPFVPAAYLIANLGVAVALIRGRPLESGMGVMLLVAAIPFYLGFVRNRAGRTD